MERPLDGKVVIVTGASSRIGIGAATARRLAASGAKLLLVAEGPADELKEVAAECAALHGAADAAVARVDDLAQAGAAAAMVEDALRRWGRVDRLFNNAAVRLAKPFGDYTAEDFDLGVAINLRSAFLAGQAVLAPMRAQGGGRIVHVASQFGSVAAPTRALYGLTKAALIHLAKTMALELAEDNIQVNTISPGPIATRPNIERARLDPAASAERMRQIPAGRFGEPEEMGEVVHWLFTTAPAFVTGHDLVADGGYTIQ